MAIYANRKGASNLDLPFPVIPTWKKTTWNDTKLTILSRASFSTVFVPSDPNHSLILWYINDGCWQLQRVVWTWAECPAISGSLYSSCKSTCFYWKWAVYLIRSGDCFLATHPTQAYPPAPGCDPDCPLARVDTSHPFTRAHGATRGRGPPPEPRGHLVSPGALQGRGSGSEGRPQLPAVPRCRPPRPATRRPGAAPFLPERRNYEIMKPRQRGNPHT